MDLRLLSYCHFAHNDVLSILPFVAPMNIGAHHPRPKHYGVNLHFGGEKKKSAAIQILAWQTSRISLVLSLFVARVTSLQIRFCIPAEIS
jgi:hypothetical protein